MSIAPSPSRVRSTLNAIDARPRASSDAKTAGALRRYLNAYWLRPENAVWMTLRHLVLASQALESPSADLSCGDGLFSFLHCGGELDESFDVFQSVARLDEVSRTHADMFDVVDDGYRPPITRQPSSHFDVGADLKPALLEKAARLNFYATHVQADNNLPQPFDDGCFAAVHCNAAYWVREIDLFLRELRRITRGDGRIILHVKLADMKRYTLEGHRDLLGTKLLDILGRGRMSTWPTLASRGEWERRFARAGLRIESATPLATRTHAQIWDIGLRPIAPLLVRMASGLTPENRLTIKRDWVALLMDLCLPLCDPDLELLPATGDAAEVQYVLRPE